MTSFIKKYSRNYQQTSYIKNATTTTKNDQTSSIEYNTGKIRRFLQLKTNQNITNVLLLKTKIMKLFVLNLALIAPHNNNTRLLVSKLHQKIALVHFC